MKINIKLPGGGTLDFEGNAEDFQRVTEFLADPPASFTESGTPARPPFRTGHQQGLSGEDGEPEPIIDGTSPLDARNVATRLESVGARSDMERVTVMAQMAVEAGEEGLDYPTVDRLYTELGYRKPARFPKTFSNAKAAGLVRNPSYGLWRPTVRGE